MLRLIFVLGVALVACAGPRTRVEMAWTAPAAQRIPLRHVVTMFISPDGVMRRAAEDRMANELANHGIVAMPAYRILADTDLQNLEQVKTTLRDRGYDGILTMRMVDTQTELQYVPPTFDAYWGWAEPYFYSRGYAYSETVVRMETSAYSLVTNQLVWSALSKTTDPRSTRGLINDVSRTVASRLARQGLAG